VIRMGNTPSNSIDGTLIFSVSLRET